MNVNNAGHQIRLCSRQRKTDIYLRAHIPHDNINYKKIEIITTCFHGDNKSKEYHINITNSKIADLMIQTVFPHMSNWPTILGHVRYGN